MAPSFAFTLYLILLSAVLLAERNREGKFSKALWLPTFWILIAGSRMVSLWFVEGPRIETMEAVLEGSPLDRRIFTGLMLIGAFVLYRRRIPLKKIIKQNKWLFLLIGFAGMSILWSDYSYVVFKRWVKGMGTLIMVLVALTDTSQKDPPVAVIRRMAIILIPLSVVLIKYFPEFGRSWSPWTGDQFYQGVTSNKNALGILCMVSGIIILWGMLDRMRNKSGERNYGIVIDFVYLGMIFWHFTMIDSATSLVSLVVGLATLFFVMMPAVRRNPKLVHAGIVSMIAVFLVLQLSFNFVQSAILGMERDLTLTGRTELWAEVLEVPANRIVGTGYSSFWLGERAEYFWDKYQWQPNQAHNGYLEVFLNLGTVGLILLIVMLASVSARTIRLLGTSPGAVGVRFAFIVVACLHNMAEATFLRETSLMWFVFLLMSMQAGTEEDQIDAETEAAHAVNTR